jgi:small subunit ribosomal protein S8
MNVVDPVADYLTRIRNAQQAAHRHVDIPASKLKRAMTQILLDKGYVRRFINVDDGKQGLIRVYLKYEKERYAGDPFLEARIQAGSALLLRCR